MAGLHLGVAVRAEQDTLSGLLPRLLDTPGEPLMRERKALPVRVEVMELQGGDAAVVSAHPAAAARLSYKGSLDLPPSLGHTRLGATPAPVSAPPVEPEAGGTVARAGHPNLPGRVGRQRRLPPAVRALDSPPQKPVAHRGDRPVECIGYLAQAEALPSELLEKRAFWSPACSEPLGPRRTKPMLACPVSNRGRMHAGFPADLFEGLASAELTCQPVPLHEHMFALGSDGMDRPRLGQPRRRPEAEGRRG
jgi:hypothetical protein